MSTGHRVLPLPSTNASARAVEIQSADIGSAQVADFTLALTQNGQLIPCTKGSGQTVTIAPNATVAFPVGARIRLLQKGAGQITVAATGPATVHGSPTLKSLGQYAEVSLTQIAADEWYLTGQVALT